ncbi:MAG TPA: hypothetical protein VGF05_15150 [Bryobacteraceae bacterium]|jgi:hypothetical protein
MTAISGSLRLRPTRIGFLVDPNDMESVRRIFQVCTCSWGGAFNPIIPVCTGIPEAWNDPPLPPPSPTELARGYLEFFEPDVYVEARPGLADQIGLSQTELDYGQPRIISLDSYFTADSQYPFSMPFGVDSLDIYQALYDREYRFVSRHERRVALFEADPAASPFIEAAFGGFPAEGPLQPLSRAYVDAFGPVKLIPNAANWIKVIKEDFWLPLSFTMERLKRDDSGWGEPTLFVVDPASSLDLIDLWNIHQFRPQVLPVNLSWLQDASEFLTEFMQANYRPLPGNPNGVMIRTTIQFARSIVSGDYERAVGRGKAILSETGITRTADAPWSMKLWYDRIWTADRDEYVHRPQRAEVTAAAADLELNLEDEGPSFSCRFAALSPEFSSRYAHGAARWVNVLKLRNYTTNDTLALTLPSSFTDRRARRLRLGEPTIISREGFVLPQKYRDHREYFRLITGRDAVIDWLKQRGIDAQPSAPGRIADQVLSSLGGFWGTNLLADRDTITLLDEMAKSVRRYADGKVEEFPDRSVEVKRWRDLVNRRFGARHGFECGATLDRFVEAHVFRLGLVLPCTNCLKKNWFGIDGLKEDLICERCLRTYKFPQGSLNLQQTPWHYRVVGPYSVPNFAEGAYSTVLALTVFARRLGADNPKLTYTTGLDFRFGEGVPFEVDFTFWYQRGRMFGRDEEPALVFGEAKSFAVESFKDNDVARMWKLAEAFPGALMVFATLKDELSAAERTAIGQFATWGRERLPDGRPRTPVIVLTATELFCDWDVEGAWKEVGGQRAAFVASRAVRLENLWTLADLTQQVYLGLPDPHARFHPPMPPVPATSTPE